MTNQTHQSDDQKVAVAEPPVKREQKTRVVDRTRPKHQPPYAVIVENDDHHTFAYVIEMLCKVCGHEPERAFELTEQIHVTGRAAVWTGALEVAELKRDQIRGYGPDFYASRTVRFPLGVRLEPMPGD